MSDPSAVLPRLLTGSGPPPQRLRSGWLNGIKHLLDLAYHDLHRGRGLYYLLQRAGAVDRAARDIDIFEAKSAPPHGHPPV